MLFRSQVENQRRSAAQDESLNRLEDSIAKLEMRLPAAEFERRLDNIERSVSDMADRMDRHDPAEHFDAGMKAISHRVEALEKDHKDLLGELRTLQRRPEFLSPAQRQRAAEFITRFSALVAAAPWRRFTFEINPLKLTRDEAAAVDGLLIVEGG